MAEELKTLRQQNDQYREDASEAKKVEGQNSKKIKELEYKIKNAKQLKEKELKVSFEVLFPKIPSTLFSCFYGMTGS